MIFSKKTKRLKTIDAAYTSLSQIASYVIRLKEEHGFETLAIKIIKHPRLKSVSRCEFHDTGDDEALRDFFKYKNPSQIEDEIYSTPFHPFNSITDDSGMTIISKLDKSMEVNHEHSRFTSKKTY